MIGVLLATAPEQAVALSGLPRLSTLAGISWRTLPWREAAMFGAPIVGTLGIRLAKGRKA